MFFKKNLTRFSDEEIVSLYKSSGKTHLVGELYKRYYHLTYMLCRRMLKDGETSKDATMDIFENLHKKILNHNIENFKMWLYAVAKNHCLMIIRKKRNEKIVSLEDFLINSKKSSMENDEDLHHNSGLVTDKELHSFIEQLDEYQSKCLKLFYFEGLSYNQIAKELGIDYKKVKSSIQSGRKNLKKIIENYLKSSEEKS